MIQATNPQNYTDTFDGCVAAANFKVMTPQQQQPSNTKPVPHAYVLLINNHSEECEHIISQLFHEITANVVKRWYPVPETSGDLSKLNRI